jgi:hypothetical protein
MVKVRVLDTFKLRLKVTNKNKNSFDNIKMMLQLPDKFSAKTSSVILPTVGPQETKEVVFDIAVKDYTKESATLKLRAQMGDTEIVSKDIPLSVEIPEFAILQMPGSETVDGDSFCVDLYYVLNRAGEEGKYDVELDLTDPVSVFGKSVIVDYVADIDTGGEISIVPMVSNPYCLPSGKDYNVGGYLYKEGVFGIVSRADESSSILSADGQE